MALSAVSLQCLVLSAISTQMAIKMHVFGEDSRLKGWKGDHHNFKYYVFFISTGKYAVTTFAVLFFNHTCLASVSVDIIIRESFTSCFGS